MLVVSLDEKLVMDEYNEIDLV